MNKNSIIYILLVLGLLFGLAQCARTMGFTLYAVYLLFDLYVFYRGKNRGPREWRLHLLETAGVLLVVFIISNFLMMATWPLVASVELVDILHVGTRVRTPPTSCSSASSPRCAATG